jgi:hypothetical protein
VARSVACVICSRASLRSWVCSPLALKSGDVALYDSQQIVEVMRNAAGEVTDCIHLL